MKARPLPPAIAMPMTNRLPRNSYAPATRSVVPSSGHFGNPRKVRPLVVESLALLEDDHVSRVAHDDLTCAANCTADFRGTNRAANEVFFAGDDEGRSGDVSKYRAKVEAGQLLAEHALRIAVDRLRPERVQVGGLRRTELREVERHTAKRLVPNLLVGSRV